MKIQLTLETQELILIEAALRTFADLKREASFYELGRIRSDLAKTSESAEFLANRLESLGRKG